MRFGLFLIDSKSIFQGQQKAAALAAAKRAGAQLEVQFAEGDSRVQREQIFAFLREEPRPDAVVVEPVEDAGMRFVAMEALKRGVAWACMNRNPPYLADLRRDPGGVVVAVTAEGHGIGRIQAEQYRALLPAGGTVLYITGPSQTQSAIERLEGMETAKGDAISIVRLVGAWTEQSGEKVVEDWISTTRGFVPFDLVGAQNDDMAVGARNALARLSEPYGKPEWVTIQAAGVDGMPEYGQRLVAEGDLAATIVKPTTTDKAVDLLVRVLRDGQTYEPLVSMPVQSHPTVPTLRPAT